MHLFGKGKQKKETPSLEEAITKLARMEDMLNKRAIKLQHDVDTTVAEIRKLMAQKNKKAALQKLKYKKRYEQSLDQIEQQKDNIQTIKMKLEEAAMQRQMYEALHGATAVLSEASKSKEEIEDTMDKLKEAVQDADDISSVFREPLSNDVYDDDELMAELDDIEQGQLDEQITNLTVEEEILIPSLPAQPAVALPSVPIAAHAAAAAAAKVAPGGAKAKPMTDEERELALLEASML